MFRLVRRRTVKWALGAICAASLAALPAGAGADPRTYECQHPVKTGEEAFALHHISVKVACAAVLELGKWEYQDHHIEQLYGCHYPHGPSQGGGTAYLRKHSFDGYRLSISPKYGFVMSRGDSSFAVTGTDFPLNCS